MRLFETVLLLILVFTIKAQHEEEFTLNPDGSQDLSSQVEFDGLVLKVNEVVFESILKKIKYSLILFYEENNIECEDVLHEFKKASETIVRLVPPVGMFKIVCSENKKLCSDVQKDKVPFVLWFNNENYGYFDIKNSQTFLKTAELLSSLSKIKTLVEKDELNQFISNKNYHRILAVFPHNETINDQENRKRFYDSEYLDNLFHNTFNDSFLIRSGEFNIGKILNFKLLENIPSPKIDNTSIIIYMKENLFDLPSISGIDRNELEQNSKTYSFLTQFLQERIFQYHFDQKDKNYYQTEKFVNEILLYSLPFVFPLNPNIYNLVFSGPIRTQFLYFLSLKHSSEANLKLLENYNTISRIFRQKGLHVWFGFVFFDNESREIFGKEIESHYKDEEKDFPLLISYHFKKRPEEATKEDVEMKVLKKELNQRNLEEFFSKIGKNQTIEEKEENITSEEPELISYENYTNHSNLPKVVGKNFKELVIDYPDNVLVLLEDSDSEKKNLYNRYIYLLNEIKRIVDPKILRIYRFNVELNDVFHTKLPSKYPTLRLFMRHGKSYPMDYNHGCKLETISKFLNHMIPILKLRFSEEQIISFETTISTKPKFIYDEKIDSLETVENEDRNVLSTGNNSSNESISIPQKEDL
jgi:hypothetical protein